MESDEKILSLLNITDCEISTIIDIVSTSDCNIIESTKLLKKVFRENIKHSHYMLMGYLIGYHVSTLENEAYKQNILQLCQRQN